MRNILIAMFALALAVPAMAQTADVENICAVLTSADLNEAGINADLREECLASANNNGVPLNVANRVEQESYCRLVEVGVITDTTACSNHVEPIQKSNEGRLWTLDLKSAPRHNFPLFGNVASRNAVATGVLSRSFGNGWDIALVGVRPMEAQQEGALATMGSLVLSKEVGRTTVGMELFHAPPQYGVSHLTALVPQVSWTGSQFRGDWTFDWKVGAQALLMLDTEPLPEDVFLWGEYEVGSSSGSWGYSFTPGLVVGNTGRVTVSGKVKMEYYFTTSALVYVKVLAARTKGVDGNYSNINPTPSIGVTYDFW